jgi:hypothetical protein
MIALIIVAFNIKIVILGLVILEFLLHSLSLVMF